MIGFLFNLLKPYALSLLKWAAVAGAVAAILLGARNAGRNAERLENYERDLRRVREAKDVEDLIDAADRDELDRLRTKWTRP